MKYIKTYEKSEKTYPIYFDFFSEKFTQDMTRLIRTLHRLTKEYNIDVDIFFNGVDNDNKHFFSLWAYPKSDEEEKILKLYNFAINKNDNIKNKYDARKITSNINGEFITEDHFLALIAANKYNL